MRKIATLGALAAFGIALVAPAVAQDEQHHNICLQTTRIDRTTVVNPQKILFRMKDGKVWSSHLRTPCIGLRFNGFVYDTSLEEVCGGLQTIHVLRTNEACVLGPFEPETVGQHAS